MDNVHLWARFKEKLELGDTFITPFALEQIPYDDLVTGLERHVIRNWGPYGGADEVLPTSGCPGGTLLISQQSFQLPTPPIFKKAGVEEDSLFGESTFTIMTHSFGQNRRTTVLLPNVDLGDITLLPLELE